MQAIAPLGQVHRTSANHFSFGGDLYGSGGGSGRLKSHFDREPLTAEHLPGQRYGFEHQTRLGASRQGYGIHGYPELLSLPDAARNASPILVAVRHQKNPRHHSRRQRGGAIQNGTFEVGA